MQLSGLTRLLSGPITSCVSRHQQWLVESRYSSALVANTSIIKNFFERSEPQKGDWMGVVSGFELINSSGIEFLQVHTCVYASTPPAFARALRTSVWAKGTL